MDDRKLMETLLNLEKGCCDLYLHGSLESVSGNVHNAFSGALNQSLCMQNEIYCKMAAQGWYKTDAAEQNKLNTVKQSFSSGV